MHIIPDLKRLEAKYAKELVVIGVHSAKFLTEKQGDNIREAILKYDLEHPVVNDRDFKIWNEWGVNAWPTVVLIDPAGKIVGGSSGEGIYEAFDRALTAVIAEFDKKKGLNRKPLKLALEKDTQPRSVLAFPGKIQGDAGTNRLFLTDSGHHRLVVTSTNGDVKQAIGSGMPGFADGDLETAQFRRPQGLCHDAAADVLYVADTGNHSIRKVDLKAGKVSTVFGTGRQLREYPPRGGTGTEASLNSPWDVLLRGDTLYIAMAGTHQLWRAELKTGRIDPYVGSSRENILDGPHSQAQLAQPSGLATDGKLLYFADTEASGVRSAGFTDAGEVKTIIGTGLFDFGDVDGQYPAARLQHNVGVAWHEGRIYVADTYNHKIKRIDPNSKTLETVVGAGKRGTADGEAKLATLNSPNGLAFVGGKAYITDTHNHAVRVWDPASGRVTTLSLKGLEKLAAPSMPAFSGKEQTLPSQTVAAAAKELRVSIQLPKGTKFNTKAPFGFKVTSSEPAVVAIGAVPSSPSPTLVVPLTVKAGAAVLTVELTVNYCSEGNEGLCYFKDLKLKLPVTVAAQGAEAAQVKVSLAGR